MIKRLSSTAIPKIAFHLARPSAMSFILPAVLQVIATQYVAFALPTPNTTSAAIETLLSSTLASCRDLYSCRSIVGLVWSCLTTFFLCTWVTIHPDVPSENKTSWSFNYIFDSRPRGGLLVLMLCAPELVVASAYDQWTNACRYVVRLSKQCPNVRWTETHGIAEFRCLRLSLPLTLS